MSRFTRQTIAQLLGNPRHLKGTVCLPKISCVQNRVGRYFDILIYRDISNRDYRIEAKNLSDDLSKLSSCSMTIVILLRNMYIACRILNKLKVSLHSSNKYTLKKCISKASIIVNAFHSSCTACS